MTRDLKSSIDQQPCGHDVGNRRKDRGIGLYSRQRQMQTQRAGIRCGGDPKFLAEYRSELLSHVVGDGAAPLVRNRSELRILTGINRYRIDYQRRVVAYVGIWISV
jgi:hypothetical protein